MPFVPLRQRRYALAAAIVAGLVALTAGALYLRPSVAAPSNQPPPATPVLVATVVQTEVATWDEFSGRLEAVERVDVRSRVAGAVQSIHFTEGALVNRGDLLVTIDPAPYVAEADRAEAQVVAAQARVAYTTTEGERAQRLWDASAIARHDLDERSNALKEAQANLRAAEAALQSARLNLGYTQVRAPVSGRVGRLEVTVGNLVAAGPGAPVLTTLVSVNPIYASFDADEQVVARALKDVADAHGQLGVIPVDLGTAAGNTVLHGHLQLVDNQVNARSGTVRARAVFDNKDGVLMPGQFAKVRMGRPKTTTAVLVNERAVGTDQSKKFVMVVGVDNKAEYREVSLGNTVDGLRIVTSGLNAGERIVVNGLQRIRPGALIEPQPGSMEGTSAAASAGPKADVVPASAGTQSTTTPKSQRKGT
jgi:multidrug efflux system membrane fusion protein